MYKIVFCGTPEFAVPSLGALHQSDDFQVDMVFTQPDRPSGRGKKLKASPVKQLCLEQGLQVETPEKLSSSAWVETIKNGNYDLGVVVAYGQILSQEFLDSFKFGCVNVHSSLLPRWRGAAPMQRAIMAGDLETGVSLQRVVKKLDAGDVIAERKIQLPIEMGTKELYEKLSHLGAELVLNELKLFLKSEITPRPQDESVVTHAKKIMKEEGPVDWQQSALDVHNKIRGLNLGGPFASTVFQGKALKLHKSLLIQEDFGARPGVVTEIKKESFVVAAGKGCVELFEVQPESKARMKAADFIRGYHLKKGDQLG